MKLVKTIVATAVIVFTLTTVAMAGVQRLGHDAEPATGAAQAQPAAAGAAQPAGAVTLSARQFAALLGAVTHDAHRDRAETRAHRRSAARTHTRDEARTHTSTHTTRRAQNGVSSGSGVAHHTETKARTHTATHTHTAAQATHSGTHDGGTHGGETHHGGGCD